MDLAQKLLKQCEILLYQALFNVKRKIHIDYSTNKKLSRK